MLGSRRRQRGGANGNTFQPTGEGYGAIQFIGTFSSISWNATADENWNGFTIGIPDTSTPEPATFALIGGALFAIALGRKAVRK